jgi:Fe-S cluster assembly protein SufD
MNEVMTIENKDLNFYSREFFNHRMEELALPPILEEKIKAAFSRFSDMPLPNRKMEEWRKTDISGIAFNDYIPLAGEKTVLKPEETPGIARMEIASGKTKVMISKEFLATGLIFTPLSQALERYPDLLENFFDTTGSSDDFAKFRNWNTAFFNRGVFIYIPDNVTLESPLEILIKGDLEGGNLIMRNLVVAGKNSKSLVKFKYLEENNSSSALINVVDEIICLENSRLEVLNLQNCGNNTNFFHIGGANQKKDSELNWNTLVFGGKLHKSYLGGEIAGRGANTRLNGIYYATGTQNFDLRTMQIHRAGNTNSDLLFKGAVQDKAHTVYQGMIQVKEGTSQVDAYQTNKNLILNSGAKADSIPGLEILADDVKCSHGATIGHIDEEEIFYLRSRGLPEREAREMIIAGFFEDVLARVHDDSLTEIVRDLIEKKIKEN